MVFDSFGAMEYWFVVSKDRGKMPCLKFALRQGLTSTEDLPFRPKYLQVRQPVQKCSRHCYTRDWVTYGLVIYTCSAKNINHLRISMNDS